MAQAIVDSPLGPLMIVASDRGVSRVELVTEASPSSMDEAGPGSRAAGIVQAATRQLEAYFAGERASFDLPLDIRGSDFQQRVWHAIAAIPFGRTRSYGQVAADAGAPNAYRAAGSACGANPVMLLIPCHRVIGADGSLHGYGGGGLQRKAWLLRHESLPDGNGYRLASENEIRTETGPMQQLASSVSSLGV